MKHDEQQDFLEFLTTHEVPPADLIAVTRKDILFMFNKTSLLSKFILLQTLGALFTLSFCPQFGVGLPEGHGITHILRIYGDGACAAFCGSLFLLSGTALASFVMKQDEVFWIWKRFKMPLIILPSVFWTLLMFFNITFKFNPETVIYHIVWITSALLTEEIFLYLKNLSYKGELLKLKP
ncbi:MAG: hypothetical protein K2P81_14655 [Bacteriovoracaceae bacterium]|nr:hypothetical protein [Bacteriovoracaceae bacterium]